MLMQIADYLEGSLTERNDLLLAAQYLPEQPEWEGDESRRAFEQAQKIMESLPYPAVVVTRTFQIQAANEFFLRLLRCRLSILFHSINVIQFTASFTRIFGHAPRSMQKPAPHGKNTYFMVFDYSNRI